MICEIRLINPNDKSSNFEFRNIKILTEPYIQSTMTPNDPKAVGLTEMDGTVTLYQKAVLCDCDGTLLTIDWSDLEGDIQAGHYELVQKTAIPLKLKNTLMRLREYQLMVADNLVLNLEEQEDFANLSRNVWDMVPSKWCELFELLVNAGCISIIQHFCHDEQLHPTFGFTARGFDKPSENNLNYRLRIGSYVDFLFADPTNVEKFTKRYSKLFTEMLGEDNFEVVVKIKGNKNNG